jgi:Putative alpha-1,2-mannosidase
MKTSFIQSATLDGMPYNKSYINHRDLLEGKTLVLIMGNKPNKAWAVEQNSRPYSLSR